MISIAVAPEAIEGGAGGGNNKATALLQSHKYFTCTGVAFLLLVVAVIIVGSVVLGFVTNQQQPSGSSGNIDSLLKSSNAVSVYEVLTMPDSNTDCRGDFNPSITNFCIVRWGCEDRPWSPGGRCGLFQPTANEQALQLVCSNPSNQKRIIGSSGVFTRRITTYKVNITSASGTLRPLKQPYNCQDFWPVLQQVINTKTPSTSWVSQGWPYQYAIQGPVEKDPNVWFNMCGFCPFTTLIRMYAPQSRSRFSTCIFVKMSPLTLKQGRWGDLRLRYHSYNT
jgi:hypothetical protein